MIEKLLDDISVLVEIRKKSNRERKLTLYRYENVLFLQQRATQADVVERSVSDTEQNNEFVKGLYDGIKLQYDTEKCLS